MSGLTRFVRRLATRLAGTSPYPSTREGAQLLLAVAERAMALEPDADEVLRACSVPGPVPGAVAQRGGPLIAEFWRLREDVDAMPLPMALWPIREQLSTQLSYHQLMVHETLNMAMSTVQNPHRDQLRYRITGLGSPAAGLARIVDALRAVAAASLALPPTSNSPDIDE